MKKFLLLFLFVLLALILVTSCEPEEEPLPSINTYGLDLKWFCQDINAVGDNYGERIYGHLIGYEPYDTIDDFSKGFFCSVKGATTYEFSENEMTFSDWCTLQVVVDGKVQTNYKLSFDEKGRFFDNNTGNVYYGGKIGKVEKIDSSTGWSVWDYEDITDTLEAVPYLGWVIVKEIKKGDYCVLVDDPSDLYRIGNEYAFDWFYDRYNGDLVIKEVALESNSKFKGKVSVLAGLGPRFTAIESETPS